MSYLFIDSTYLLTVGLLDSSCKWVETRHLDSTKSASAIHTTINQLLTKNSCKLDSLSGVIYVSGPGSYTGLRVSTLISELLDWQGIQKYSYHQMDLAKFYHPNSGMWLSKAFKGEIFYSYWKDGGECVSGICAENELSLFYVERGRPPLFTHGAKFELEADEICDIDSLLDDDCSSFFTTLVEKTVNKPILYYRAADKDFKKSLIY
ncbi:MAG: hypothetical protein HOE90_09550 [Bacteriovoracaceae bacterium]|jgi:tRNA A37 threonylcarbamoyladenosine modification protein TsaB|nr:hypothetical protein [Bacteriovoracaceae bacterium]